MYSANTTEMHYRDFKGGIIQKKAVVKPIQHILTYIINSIGKERYVWNSLVSIDHKSKLKLFVLFYLFIKIFIPISTIRNFPMTYYIYLTDACMSSVRIYKTH